MKKITGYRVDPRELKIGEEITSQGDHKANMKPCLTKGEAELRKYSDEKSKIRGTSLYVFDKECTSRRYSIGTEGHIYELEFCENDVLHKADMHIVNKISKESCQTKRASLVEQYWRGCLGDEKNVEILVRKAIVKAKLKKNLSHLRVDDKKNENINELGHLFDKAHIHNQN